MLCENVLSCCRKMHEWRMAQSSAVVLQSWWLCGRHSQRCYVMQTNDVHQPCKL